MYICIWHTVRREARCTAASALPPLLRNATSHSALSNLLTVTYRYLYIYIHINIHTYISTYIYILIHILIHILPLLTVTTVTYRYLPLLTVTYRYLPLLIYLSVTSRYRLSRGRVQVGPDCAALHIRLHERARKCHVSRR
jgi:hypothetical protein